MRTVETLTIREPSVITFRPAEANEVAEALKKIQKVDKTDHVIRTDPYLIEKTNERSGQACWECDCNLNDYHYRITRSKRTNTMTLCQDCLPDIASQLKEYGEQE